MTEIAVVVMFLCFCVVAVYQMKLNQKNKELEKKIEAIAAEKKIAELEKRIKELEGEKEAEY